MVSFRWGHVRQLDRVSRQLLARAWQAGAGPGDSPLTIGLDSTICETYGLAKEGARHHGYTGVRGYHPLLAIAAGTGDVLMARLREARPTPFGALDTSCGRRWDGYATPEPGDNSRCGPTAVSIPTPSSPSAAGWMSASPSPSASTPACAISSRRYPRRTGRPFLTGWTVPPMWPRPPTPPSQSEADAAPVRLIVRRVKPTPGSQLALFATYSYHGFITDRDGETLELEADHRRHAEVENAIRDLKYGVGLNHMPSGRFAANGAWLAVQVMAHNLARWTARIGLGEQIVTTKTLRRRGLRPGRTAHPLGTPPHPASATALALGNPVQSRPDPAASHSTPNLTAPVRQCPQRPLQLAPVRSASASCRVLSRHLAHHTHCRPPSASPKAPADRRQPPIYPNSSPDHPRLLLPLPFQCPLPVHPCPSVDSG